MDNSIHEVKIVPESVENVQRQSRAISVIISMTGATTWFKNSEKSITFNNYEKKFGYGRIWK